jgi:predicted acetyltransferase
MPEIRRQTVDDKTNIGLYEGDERLAGLTVFDLPMRIGDCVVRCGGIGGVETAQQHRGNGYASQVLNDTLAYMREAGMAVSVLFGIPGFYPRWGYTPAMVEATLEIETAVGLQAPAALAVRDMLPEDAPAVARLYELENASRTGTIVRPPDGWPGFRFGVDWNGNVAAYVAEHDGRVVGYAAYNSEPWETQVAEICGGRAAMGALLRRLAERAAQRHREKMRFRVPPDHRFVAYAVGLGCCLTIEYPHSGAGMARIIDQQRLLDMLTPLLARRLEAAGSAWRGRLAFETQLGSGHVDLGAGERQAVRLTQERLTQLVLGYRSATDLWLDRQLACEPHLLPALEAMLPAGAPYMWHPDRI